VSEAPDALSVALASVGDRWSLLVVDALMDGPLRFGDLDRRIPGIATNVLTQRLRHLETQRVVLASPYSDRPPRYTYSLTDSGIALAGTLRLLAKWSADFGGSVADTARHSACGTPLETRWWCPTCDVPVDTAGDESVWI